MATCSNLGDSVADIASLMQVGAALFKWSDKGKVGAPSEAVHWLFGTTEDTRRRPAGASVEAGELESVSFDDAGYYLLQWGDPGSHDHVSVVFDCGELGFGSLAAHGHADALSVVVRAGGVDLLVDPGTYDTSAFRNGVSISGARPPITRWRSTAGINPCSWDRFSGAAAPSPSARLASAAGRRPPWQGEHDGYRDLPESRDPAVEPSTSTGCPVRWTITDEIQSDGAHDVRIVLSSL